MSFWTEMQRMYDKEVQCSCDYCGEAGLHVDEALFLSKPLFSPAFILGDRPLRARSLASPHANERERQIRKPVMCPSCTRAILDLRHDCGKIKDKD